MSLPQIRASPCVSDIVESVVQKFKRDSNGEGNEENRGRKRNKREVKSAINISLLNESRRRFGNTLSTRGSDVKLLVSISAISANGN